MNDQEKHASAAIAPASKASGSSRFLLIDTSGRVGQVALAVGARIIAASQLDANRRHARDLTPAIGALLGSLSWKPRTIEALMVNSGPGSYTGLRVGIMAGKVFAYVTGCALVAVECFRAVAHQAPQQASELDVIGDAQRELIYVQRFQQREAELVAQSRLEIRPFAEWKSTWREPTWVTGPGLTRFAEFLESSSRIVDPLLWHPQPASLLQEGLARYESGQRDDPFTLEPIYLRPSSAEEKALL